MQFVVEIDEFDHVKIKYVLFAIGFYLRFIFRFVAFSFTCGILISQSDHADK